MKNYDEKSEVGYILEVDVQHSNKLHELHSDLPLLPERKKLGKVSKILFFFHVIHINSLKQGLSHGSEGDQFKSK